MLTISVWTENSLQRYGRIRFQIAGAAGVGHGPRPMGAIGRQADLEPIRVGAVAFERDDGIVRLSFSLFIP